MAKKVSSKLQQQHYGSYKVSNRWKVNRERKLTKLLKQHPNNKQIAEALKNLHYRRKTPKAPQWTKRTKYLAQLIKKACGHCPQDIFNKNTQVAEKALSSIKPKIESKSKTETKVEATLKLEANFKLGSRVRMGVLK